MSFSLLISSLFSHSFPVFFSFFLSVFSFLLFLFTYFVSVQSQCTADWNGQNVDISALGQIPDSTASDTDECSGGMGYTYAAAFCRAVSAETSQGCNTASANFCQTNCAVGNGNGCPKPLAYPVSLMSQTTYSFLTDGDGNQIGVTMTGYNTPNQMDKQGIASVYCPNAPGAPAATTATSSDFPVGSTKCNGHTIVLTSQAACNLVSGKGHSNSKNGGGGGLSGGWIFCIILFVTVPVYFAVGCGLNYHKGSRSCGELTPNYAFWSAIPALMKDGAVFTWRKLRGLCGAKSTGTYETL
jgi:hypothetical protein